MPTNKAVRIKNLDIYKVMGNSDLTEGRGPSYIAGIYLNPNDAKVAAKGNYVMGSNCPIEKENVKVVEDEYGAIFLLGERVIQSYTDPRIIKERAMKKLTEEEIEALGLKY